MQDFASRVATGGGDGAEIRFVVELTRPYIERRGGLAIDHRDNIIANVFITPTALAAAHFR